MTWTRINKKKTTQNVQKGTSCQKCNHPKIDDAACNAKQKQIAAGGGGEGGGEAVEDPQQNLHEIGTD